MRLPYSPSVSRVPLFALFALSCCTAILSRAAPARAMTTPPTSAAAPESPPAAAPVLHLTFEASPAGYRIAAARLGHPVQHPSTLAGTEVVITGLDDEKRVVDTVRIANPRIAHASGARNSRTQIVGTAMAAVMLLQPERVRSVSVEVVSGPNANYRAILAVPPLPLAGKGTPKN